MNKRDWLILAMSVCWGNFWWTLGFLLYNITGIWQFLVLFVMGFLGFYFPIIFEEESEYY
ncbi:hypothetical protein LCGC14_2573060 [marine sediment metagenome]|uniref:Uncharacterized protein n=1 Tax=marine sediment metagenome TaxID=412755 RepID=A0A0F9AH48_9ZZZZ